MYTLLIVALAGWLWWTCTKAAAGIYRRKARNPNQGMLLGLALGPLGVVVAACTPKMDLHGKERCLRCRRWVDQNLNQCPHCGLKLRVATTTSRAGLLHGVSEWPVEAGSRRSA